MLGNRLKGILWRLLLLQEAEPGGQEVSIIELLVQGCPGDRAPQAARSILGQDCVPLALREGLLGWLHLALL